MATSPSATPTPITPPRVPLIDERTGLIDRAWYLFFLSLFRLSETIDSATLGASAESLMASYDAALRALAQTTETQPPQNNCCADVLAVHQDVQSAPSTGVAELAQEVSVLRQETQSAPASGVTELAQEVSVLRQETQSAPASGVAELAQEISDVRQQLQTLPRSQLGTFAALQQANLPWATFDTTPESVPTDVGTVAWDGGTTLGLQMTPNVLQRVGESEFVYVKASAAITKGQLCYHTGSVGSSSVITAAPTPIGLTDPNQIVGVAAESIALNGFGLIQISGDLRGFDTTGSSVGETWADGDPLYYNPAYVGSLTNIKPSAPNQKTYVGEVINAGSGGSGSISIRLVPGSVLGGTDSNVQFGTLANNDLIQYSTTLGYWQNVTAASVSVGTAMNLAGGLAGSVPYQSALSTTTFLSIGAANGVLTSSGTAPQWSTALTGLTGVSTTTLSASSTVTLSGGTANGVLYLNGSNVATSGTVLIFNGSNLGIGVTPSAKLHLFDSAAPETRLQIGTTTSQGSYTFYSGATKESAIGFTPNSAILEISSGRSAAWGGKITFVTDLSERMRIDQNGSVRIGTAAIATTATNGFLYIPTCAGTPTGTPTAITGLSPLVVDSTNNKLYFYSGGAWRDAGP